MSVLETLMKMQSAESITDLHDLVDAFAKSELGAGWTMLSLLRNPLSDLVEIKSSYPDAWGEHYVSENYVEVDPIVDLIDGRETPSQFDIGDLLTWGGLYTRRKRLLEECRDMGLGQGVMAPSKPEPDWFGLVNLGFSHQDQLAQDKLAALEGLSTLLSNTAMLRLQELSPAAAGHSLHSNRILSEREKSIYSYLASGLTLQQIAERLKISDRTVTFHITNGKHKLGARSREQALAKALALKEIKP